MFNHPIDFQKGPKSSKWGTSRFKSYPRYQFNLLDQRVTVELNAHCPCCPGDCGSLAGLCLTGLFRRRNQIRKLRLRVMRRDPAALMP
jgi:hypothetical protein